MHLLSKKDTNEWPKGKWLSYNQDGNLHDCKKNKQQKQQQKLNGNNNGNDISLEVFLKKLESIGIEIDVKRLRNVYWMTTKLLCSCCKEVIHIECTEEFCDECKKKIKDGELYGYE